MSYRFAALCAAFLFPLNAWSAPNIVEIQTNIGTIAVRLNPEKAPTTVANFLSYVDGGFYDKTLFHRVVKNFVIQGGGYDLATGKLKTTLAPIANESNNGLSNVSGTISMARTDDPNSATSQFFINLKDNAGLDYSSPNAGYAVFGEVISGMDVVKAIGNAANISQFPYTTNNEVIYIEKAYASDDIDPAAAITRLQVSGEGKVTSSPKGISCISSGTSCELNLPAAADKKITLKAKAAKNFAFVGWSGDCAGLLATIKLPLTQNHNCGAHFKPLAVAAPQ